RSSLQRKAWRESEGRSLRARRVRCSVTQSGFGAWGFEVCRPTMPCSRQSPAGFARRFLRLMAIVGRHEIAADAGMAQPIELETDRLRLRQWREADFGPFAEMNADPRVMEYFPAVLSRAASDTMAQRCHTLIAERGWGLWAAELLRLR